MDDADRRAIEQLHQRDQRASLERDADTLLSLMDDDIMLIPPRGEPTKGKQAVAAALRTYFEHVKDSTITEYVQAFEEIGIGPDLAFDWGHFRGAEVSAEGRAVRQRTRIMRILRRQADGPWKVYRAFWVEAQPPASWPGQGGLRG